MQAEKKPLVSIGMPIRNEECFLEEAIKSLLMQNFKEFELIILDNASEDRTEDICLRYTTRDSRICYTRNEKNIGAIKNFQKVADMSRGKYFMWASGHDIWDKEFVRRCVEIMEKDHNIVLAYPQTTWIGQEGELLPYNGAWLFDTRAMDGRISRYNAVLWGCPSPALIYGVIRVSALKKLDLTRASYAPDWLLLAELSLLGTFAQITEPLFKLRVTRQKETWDELVDRYNRELISDNSRHTTFPFWRVMRQFIGIPWRSCMDIQRKMFLTICTVLYGFVKWGPLMIRDIKRGWAEGKRQKTKSLLVNGQ